MRDKRETVREKNRWIGRQKKANRLTGRQANGETDGHCWGHSLRTRGVATLGLLIQEAEQNDPMTPADPTPCRTSPVLIRVLQLEQLDSLLFTWGNTTKEDKQVIQFAVGKIKEPSFQCYVLGMPKRSVS